MRKINYFLIPLMVLLSSFFSVSLSAQERLRLATTTSTENSGLLQHLLPAFEQYSGLKVHVIAVGTGKALRMGQDGDADVLLTHAPELENVFLSEGHGVSARDVMYNDFLLVGPKADPAKIAGGRDASVALQQIAAQNAAFISRGDDSGTHSKERELWQVSGVEPKGIWYKEAGQGMGAVLQMADELEAYTLTDRGTWLSYKAKSHLVELVEGDERLFNPYRVIAVNPDKYRDINYFGAMQLIAWLTSVPGQTAIHEFLINGERLFTPTAIRFAQ
jgi:tungstate transport system substrate-binding protein